MLARALGTSASNSTSNGDIGPEQRGVLGACWTRPAPPLLSPFVDELAWLGPELHTGLVWDSTAGDAEARARAKGARDLLERALRGPLLPAQQQQVLDALAQDPALVYRLGLAPRHLPPLVEHTPVVAYELLRRLMRSPHRAAGFLAVLAASEMSLRSMEVVNRLAGAVPLPTDFLHLYVTNCISSCENTQVCAGVGSAHAACIHHHMGASAWGHSVWPLLGAECVDVFLLLHVPCRTSTCRAGWCAWCVCSCTRSSGHA